MWPTGSLPDRLGMPPVRRTHLASLDAEYPWTFSAPRTVSRTAPAPRESIQVMAGPIAAPSPSTGTVPDHCEVQPMPTTSSGATPASARARRAEATMASHQACGDCSAPPSSVRSIPTAWKAWDTTRPVDAKTATFGPPVPRSTASTCGDVEWVGRTSVAVVGMRGAYRARPTRSRAGLRCSDESVTRPGRPRSRSRSRPCCPPRRCRRAASG